MTPRQLEVLRGVAAGKLNKQIAFELDLAEGTVKSHIAALMEKAGVSQRTQLAMFFLFCLMPDDRNIFLEQLFSEVA